MSPDAASPKHDLLNRAAREYTAFHETIQGLNEAHLLGSATSRSGSRRSGGCSASATSR